MASHWQSAGPHAPKARTMPTLESFRFEDIEIGQTLRMSRTVTEEMVRLFAAATGDVNPMHLDESFAAATPFKGCISHGMLTAGFISAAIATGLPGPGSVYVGQELRFDRPVRAGDTITVELTVQEKIPGKNHIVLKTVARNQNNKTVVSGAATVLPPPDKVRVEQPAEPRFLPA
jgi:acyl dehydratase